MLDKFLAVAYEAQQEKTASRQLVDKLKEFPAEELLAYLNGDENCKLAFAEACGPGMGRDDTWLGKYKGTPLFSKAVELEKALVELDMAEQQQRAQEQAARPNPGETWLKRDAIMLQKRMLDLDLVMAEAGGAPAEAPEVKEEKAIGELQEAQAQEKVEGGGGDAAHEATEDEALALLEQAHGGGEDVPPQGQQQPPQPPKPKAPPQQAQGGEDSEEEEAEEGQPPKKDDKPKGMSVEVKQASDKVAFAIGVGRFFAKTASPELKLKKEIAKKHPTLAKEAAENPEGHQLRRALLGNSLSSAIEAKPGSRLDAFGEATGHSMAERLKGGLKGGLGGAALGGAGGLALALANKGSPAHALGYGAGIGGGLGLIGGDLYGQIKGTHGQEASRIHGARSKHNPSEEKVAFIGGLVNAAKAAAPGFAGAGQAAKGLAQTAYAKGGLGQVASSFGNVAKNFAQKNPLTAAGIGGAAAGMVAGKMLSNSGPR